MESLHHVSTPYTHYYRRPVVAGYRIPTLIGTLPHISLLFFLFSLLNGRLYYGEARAETVTSFRPYELNQPTNRPSNAYICQPNAYAYLPAYQSIDRTTTDRTSLSDACTVLLPKWSFLIDTKLICYKERNQLILRLSYALAVKNDPD